MIEVRNSPFFWGGGGEVIFLRFEILQFAFFFWSGGGDFD